MRVYYWRNRGDQEDQRRWNPSEGNEGEHLWHCCNQHLSKWPRGRRRSSYFANPPPPPQQVCNPIATVGSAECTKETLRSQKSFLTAPQVGLADTLSDAPRVPPHRLCHGGDIEVTSPEEPASSRPQKVPMSRPHSRTPQVNLKARHPMVGHNWNHQ